MQNISSLKLQKGLLPVLLILVGTMALVAAVVADLMGLSTSGFGATQLSLALSGFAVLIAGVVLVLPDGQRYIGEWLLVGAGVVAVAVAADLLVIGGLSSFGSKQLMLASVAFGIVTTRIGSRVAGGQQGLDEWLNAFTFDRLKAAKFLSIVTQLGDRP
jgi:hypothetical protein